MPAQLNGAQIVCAIKPEDTACVHQQPWATHSMCLSHSPSISKLCEDLGDGFWQVEELNQHGYDQWKGPWLRGAVGPTPELTSCLSWSPAQHLLLLLISSV